MHIAGSHSQPWQLPEGMGEVIRGKRTGKGNGHQGMCIKDLWTKSEGGRFEGGKWGWEDGGKLWQENEYNFT